MRSMCFPRQLASIQHSYPPRKMGNRPNSDLLALPPMNLGYHGLPQAKQTLPNGLLSTAKEAKFQKWNEHSAWCQQKCTV